ncbi:acyl transferase [Bradyrhizobium japonicum]|uniref:acyl transferase n=1 Tax=Bradyrhizobium japonicum TaxID=375 RepID=UPI00200FF6ED|nr:acyl transferase [Bradyrhizobium japonicum]
MAAWSVAGTAAEALRLTNIRARLMDGVVGPDGRLGYVRGLERTALEHLLEKHHCEIAIRNLDLLVVVEGAECNIVDLCWEATTQGAARAGLLSVKIASHTRRLGPACTPLQQALATSRRTPVADQRTLLAGDGGERIFSVTDATAKLACQIARPIDWATTLEALVELGVDQVLDLGPGHALAEMMQGFHPSIRCYAADGFRTIDGLRSWVASEEAGRAAARD